MEGSKHLADPFGLCRESEDFQIARYSALQQAWMKRIEIEYQLIGVTLVLMGTSLSVGLQYSRWILLLYPIVAVSLAAIWTDNNIKLREIKELIGDHDEDKFTSTSFKRWMRFAVLFLIVCTEIASVLLAPFYPHPSPMGISWDNLPFDIVLLLDAVALFVSLYFFRVCATHRIRLEMNKILQPQTG